MPFQRPSVTRRHCIETAELLQIVFGTFYDVLWFNSGISINTDRPRLLPSGTLLQTTARRVT